MNQIEELLKRVLTSLLVDMVISGARGGGEFLKIKIRPVVIRDILYFQVSKYTDKQVFHENLTAEEAAQSAAGWIMNDFGQAQIRTQGDGSGQQKRKINHQNQEDGLCRSAESGA